MQRLSRPLVEIIPYVPLAATLRFGVAILTYCGRLTVGVTGDFDAAGDVTALARGIEAGLAEMVAVTARAAADGQVSSSTESTSRTETTPAS